MKSIHIKTLLMPLVLICAHINAHAKVYQPKDPPLTGEESLKTTPCGKPGNFKDGRLTYRRIVECEFSQTQISEFRLYRSRESFITPSRTPYSKWGYPMAKFREFTTKRFKRGRGDHFDVTPVRYSKSIERMGFDDGVQWMIFHRATTINGPYSITPMDKPVVISQGFDPDYGTSDQKTIDDLASDVVQIIPELIDRGYSVILVQYENPNASIKSNGEKFARVLKWVDSQTQEPMIVVGPSMGGLVSRWALQNIGDTKPKIKKFIAYDSPNWGAVIPMTVQAGVAALRKDNGKSKKLFSNLQSEAAKQMLLTRVESTRNRTNHTINGYFWDPTTGSVTNSPSSVFLRELNQESSLAKVRTNGYSKNGGWTPMKLVAITDGLPSGSQNLPESNRFAYIDYNTLYFRLTTQKAGVNSKISAVDIAGRDLKEYYFQEPVFLDNVPGGYRKSYRQLRKALRDAGYKGNWSVAFTGDISIKGNSHPSLTQGHAFIPTLSAVGIRPSHYDDFNHSASWQLGAGVTSLNSTQTIFDKALIPATTRVEHISVKDEDLGIPVQLALMAEILEE